MQTAHRSTRPIVSTKYTTSFVGPHNGIRKLHNLSFIMQNGNRHIIMPERAAEHLENRSHRPSREISPVYIESKKTVEWVVSATSITRKIFHRVRTAHKYDRNFSNLRDENRELVCIARENATLPVTFIRPSSSGSPRTNNVPMKRFATNRANGRRLRLSG